MLHIYHSFLELHALPIYFPISTYYKTKSICQFLPPLTQRHQISQFLWKHRSIIVLNINGLIPGLRPRPQILMIFQKLGHISNMYRYLKPITIFNQRKSIIEAANTLTIEGKHILTHKLSILMSINTKRISNLKTLLPLLPIHIQERYT